MSIGEAKLAFRLVARRARREPLAYLLGTQPFCGLDLEVTPDVLVPRPETEELVGLVLANCPPHARVRDVGTGSGAIALAVKASRPDATVDASDISHLAVAVARRNAVRLQLDVAVWMADLLATPPTCDACAADPYDVVVANLPYVAAEEAPLCSPEVAFEPPAAVFAGAGGLAAVVALLQQLPAALRPRRGVAWLEHGWRQAAAVRAAAADAGLASESIADAAGRERFAKLWVPP